MATRVAVLCTKTLLRAEYISEPGGMFRDTAESSA